MKQKKTTMEQERLITLDRALHQMHPFDSYAIILSYVECMIYHESLIISNSTIKIKRPFLLDLLDSSIDRLQSVILHSTIGRASCDWPILGFSCCKTDSKLEWYDVCFPKFMIDKFGYEGAFNYLSSLGREVGDKRIRVMLETYKNIRCISECATSTL